MCKVFTVWRRHFGVLYPAGVRERRHLSSSSSSCGTLPPSGPQASHPHQPNLEESLRFSAVHRPTRVPRVPERVTLLVCVTTHASYLGAHHLPLSTKPVPVLLFMVMAPLRPSVRSTSRYHLLPCCFACHPPLSPFPVVGSTSGPSGLFPTALGLRHPVYLLLPL